jgi:hypothetical protein
MSTERKRSETVPRNREPATWLNSHQPPFPTSVLNMARKGGPGLDYLAAGAGRTKCSRRATMVGRFRRRRTLVAFGGGTGKPNPSADSVHVVA